MGKNQRVESTSGSGSKKPPKKKLTRVVVESEATVAADTSLTTTSGTLTGGDQNAHVALARETEQQEQQQQPPQQQHDQQVQSGTFMSSENLSVVEPKNENVLSTTTGVNMIDSEIDTINQEIAMKEKAWQEAWKEMDVATKLLVAVRKSQPLDPLFQDEEHLDCVFPITKDQPREEQEQILKSYIQTRSDYLPKLHDEKEKLEEKKQHLEDRKNSGIILSNPTGNANRSGLHYTEEAFRVEYLFHNEFHDIGVLEKNNDDRKTLPKFRVKDNVESWGPCPELVKAWPLIPDNGSDDSYLTFLQNFRPLVPALDPNGMENAWRALTKKLKLIHDTAFEMAMQQSTFTPFIELLMAAAGAETVESNDYRAGQMISSSLTISCKVKENDPYEEKKLAFKPGAAVTVLDEWDAFGMMEIKRGRHPDETLCWRDFDKCTLMTAITAILVGQSIKDDNHQDENRHDEIAIPFVIVKGYTCSLYVATLDQQGIPRIKWVKYPEAPDKRNATTRSDKHDIAISPSRSRAELFVALAILLNKHKLLVDGKARDKYEAGIRARAAEVKKASSYSLNDFKKNDDGSKNSRSSSNKQIRVSGNQDAKQAAALGGVFSNLVHPFIQNAVFTDYGIVNTEAMTSPFYFLADWKPTMNGTTLKRVFLKVWKVAHVVMDYVQSEFDNYRQAYNAGIPVAEPVFDTLVRSTSSSGAEYLIFAVEYIDNDEVLDENDFLQFCISLIETVIKLHEKAGLLHCDLKPSNMRWSNQCVRLIDFGHSQQINTATWSGGTEGYEAPEIVSRTKPCSTKTEAFSVGVTMEKVLKKLNKSIQQNELCRALHEIAVRLQDPDPDTRWSLPQALRKIRNVHGNERSPPIQIKKINGDPN